MAASSFAVAGAGKLCSWLACSVLLAQVCSVVAFRAISVPIRIDCGSATSTSSSLHGTSWSADQYAEDGKVYNITSADSTKLEGQPELVTLRAFPSGGEACYNVPLATGRYLVRLGIAYNNYDGQRAGPAFTILINKVVVDFIDVQAHIQQGDLGPYFGDYLVPSNGSTLPICFQGARGAPIINSLEILPADTLSYDAGQYWPTAILRTVVRQNGGGPEIHAEPDDPGFRSWNAGFAAKSNYTQVNLGNYTQLELDGTVANSGPSASPDYLPTKMFETALEGTILSNNVTGFGITVNRINAANTWLLRFYFAELDSSVQPGDRVFDIIIRSAGKDTIVRKDFDIVQEVGPLNATTVTAVFAFRGSGQMVSFACGCWKAAQSKRQPILNGVELFEIINVDAPAYQSGTKPDYGNYYSVGATIVFVLVAILGVGLLVVMLYFAVVTFRLRRMEQPRQVAGPQTATGRTWWFGRRSLAQTQPTDDSGLPIRNNPYERSFGGSFGSDASERFSSVELTRDARPSAR